MNVKGVVAVGLLTVAAGAAYLFNFEHSVAGYAASVADSEDVMTELRRNLPRLVEERGSAFAVELTDELVQKRIIGIDECHLLLHLIGHKAVQEYGTNYDAMMGANPKKICINAFVHGIEAEVAAQGDRQQLWNFCSFMEKHDLKNGACFHGAGHSIFEQSKNITDSLQYCDSLAGGPEKDLSNCYRGVFSEAGSAVIGYDTNTGLSIQPLILESQGLSAKEPYAYCQSVAKRYQDACYSQLAKLLYSSNDAVGSIRKCESIESSSARSICTETLTGMTLRKLLDTADAAESARFIDSLDVSPEDAMVGMMDAYVSHCSTRDLFTWSTLCQELHSEGTRALCVLKSVSCPRSAR